MRLKTWITRSLMLAGWVACCPAPATPVLPDHQEFDAALQVPFQAHAGRAIVMHFEYPGAASGTPVAWQVAVLDRGGQVLREWDGGATPRRALRSWGSCAAGPAGSATPDLVRRPRARFR